MKRNVFTAAGIVLLAIYWYLVLAVTGGTPTNFLIIKDFSVSADLSLVPFRDLLAILGGNDFGGSFLQIGGNVILFAPLGFLVPFFWQGWRGAGRTIALGCAMSLFIEINQLFNYRATSVDDLILNTLGAAAGFACFLVGKRLFHLPGRAGGRAEKLPVVVLLIVWALAIARELPLYLSYLSL